MKYSILILQFFLTSTLLAQYEQLDKAVFRFVTMEADWDKSSAISVGVIDHLYTQTYHFGETAKENKTEPTDNTIYELGSCTKIFTASIIAMLKEDGKLKYEDDISIYLDKLYFDEKDITILDLLTHYSGFDKYPNNLPEKDNETSIYERYTYKDFLQFLKKYKGIKRENRVYTYSHTNYVLLTLIIEKITEQKYETVLQTKILTPLKMVNTKFTLTEDDKKRVAQGYDVFNEETKLWNLEVFKGSLGLKSTTQDMLLFLQAHMQERKAYLDIFNILQSMQEYSNDTEVEKIKVGIGWHKVQPRKKYYSFFAHSGATDGHQVYIAFLEETETAVVFMCNAKNSNYGMGSSVLKILNNKWKRKK